MSLRRAQGWGTDKHRGHCGGFQQTTCSGQSSWDILPNGRGLVFADPYPHGIPTTQICAGGTPQRDSSKSGGFWGALVTAP